MSYYASGKGQIEFVNDVSDKDKEKIFELIENYIGEGYDAENRYIEISMDGDYYEDDVKKALSDIAEIAEISNGELEYAGQDYEYWRFIYTEGAWEEQDGHVVYDDPDALVAPLTWTWEELREYLRKYPDTYPQDEEFCDEVMRRCREDKAFYDVMIEHGWDAIIYNAVAAARDRRNEGEE